jgi:hypothetical protein
VTDYSKFRKSPDMLDWLRTPQAQVFAKQLAEQEDVAAKNLAATCAKSTDPKVTAAYAHWLEMSELLKYLRNSRKESVEE